MSILVIGSIGIDKVKTPFADSGKVVGGAAIYFAWSASMYYEPVNLVSIAGGDFPQADFQRLQKRNVNLDGVQIIEDGKTFYWEGSYHDDMNNRDTLVTDLNVLEKFNPVLPAHYKHPDWVMLANLHPSLQLQVLEQLENKPHLIALDTMNFWIESALPELKKVIGKVDLLFLNDSEALELSGETNLKKAIDAIKKLGPQYICVKRGEYGAILVAGEQMYVCSTLLLDKVIDPTGAGDSFAGGVMGYLAQQKQTPTFDVLKKAIVAGTTMASFCVQDFSCKSFYELTKAQIQNRTQEIQTING